MFKGSYMKRLWIIVGTAIVLLIGVISVKAVNYREMHSSVVEFGTKENFNEFIKAEFTKSKFFNQIDYSKTVSIVAFPAIKLVSMEDIKNKNGAIVGGIYLSSGSLKYKLKPGDYGVKVIQKGSFWFAQFLDGQGNMVKEVTATVYPGKPVEQVLVSLRYSVCYIINGGIVCI